MRELKFRVWDNLKKEWVINTNIWRLKTDPNGIGEIEPSTFYWKQHPEGLTIQQYTGLKDQNKKEVYEGDILEFFTEKNELSISKVVFKYGYFGLDRGDSLKPMLLYPYTPFSEVLGNIFDNPELLK